MNIIEFPKPSIWWIFIFIFIFIFIYLIEVVRQLNRRNFEVEEDIPNKEYLRILFPKRANILESEFESFLSDIFKIKGNKQRALYSISFELTKTESGIQMYIVIPGIYKQIFFDNLYMRFPNISVTSVNEYLPNPLNEDKKYEVLEFNLTKDNLYTLQEGDFIDKFMYISSTIEKSNIYLQLCLRPVNSDYTYADSYLKSQNNNKVIFFRFIRNILRIYENVFAIKHINVANASIKLDEKSLESIRRKIASKNFEFEFRVLYEKGEDDLKTRITSLVSSINSSNEFKVNILNYSSSGFFERTIGDEIIQCLSIFEIPYIYHFPKIEYSKYTKLLSLGVKHVSPEFDFTTSDIRLGECEVNSKNKSVYISYDDMKKHSLVLGKTGMGKTSFMENIAIECIKGNESSVVIFDPHEDLSKHILELIPEDKVNDVIFLDPLKSPININPFSIYEEREIVVDYLIQIFKSYFDSWGPRLEYILRNGIITTFNLDNASIISLYLLFTDENFRKKALKTVTDPLLLNFWNNEFSAISRNSRTYFDTMSPILNKLGRIVMSEPIKKVLCYPYSQIDFDRIINGKKTLIVSLPVSTLGIDNVYLIGSMILLLVSYAKMKHREDSNLFVFIDEASYFINEFILEILKRGRKDNVGYIFSTQSLEDFHKFPSIVSHIGNDFIFQTSGSDATNLTKEMGKEINDFDFTSIEKFNCLARIYQAGTLQKPFLTWFHKTPSDLGNIKTKEDIISNSHKYITDSSKIDSYLEGMKNNVY